MHIVVAPDSYKGSLSAVGVAQAMQRGLERIFPGARFTLLPIADGGEGTVEALIAATHGTFCRHTVSDPLGRPIEAEWGILGDGSSAVIEMAAASGLPLLAPAERDPRHTTTFGTGELIRAALDHGLRRIILGIGGSATNDGGAGMAQALGVRFLGADAQPLRVRGGADLLRVARIDISGLDPRLADCEIIVACDVTNPLCGPEGASAVFGPQKGGTHAILAELDAALAHYAELARLATGRDVATRSGAGAAGGLGAGMLFFTPATLRPGVNLVLDTLAFDHLVRDADFVVTGEGRTDFQTAFGKAPVGVARAAKKHGVPVFCLSGGLGNGADDVLHHGIDALLSICDRPLSLEECCRNASELVEAAACRLARLVHAARLIPGGSSACCTP